MILHWVPLLGHVPVLRQWKLQLAREPRSRIVQRRIAAARAQGFFNQGSSEPTVSRCRHCRSSALAPFDQKYAGIRTAQAPADGEFAVRLGERTVLARIRCELVQNE